ncbi:MAG TPA: helix-turn-helix domain-containing protein [Terriglobales bacterium]|nr:helix-turn-helix domain-containing protein [Terriglobales bacterium]
MAEAARLLALSERSIQYLIADGRIESLKLGRRRLVLLASLRRLVAADRPGDVAPAVAR